MDSIGSLEYFFRLKSIASHHPGGKSIHSSTLQLSSASSGFSIDGVLIHFRF